MEDKDNVGRSPEPWSFPVTYSWESTNTGKDGKRRKREKEDEGKKMKPTKRWCLFLGVLFAPRGFFFFLLFRCLFLVFPASLGWSCCLLSTLLFLPFPEKWLKEDGRRPDHPAKRKTTSLCLLLTNP